MGIVSDAVIEQLKAVDVYIANGEFSILIACPDLYVLKEVFSLVGRKCLLLNRFDYLMVPSIINSDDMACILRRTENGGNCIVGINMEMRIIDVPRSMQSIDKCVVVYVDNVGSTADIKVKR